MVAVVGLRGGHVGLRLCHDIGWQWQRRLRRSCCEWGHSWSYIQRNDPVVRYRNGEVPVLWESHLQW